MEKSAFRMSQSQSPSQVIVNEINPAKFTSNARMLRDTTIKMTTAIKREKKAKIEEAKDEAEASDMTREEIDRTEETAKTEETGKIEALEKSEEVMTAEAVEVESPDLLEKKLTSTQISESGTSTTQSSTRECSQQRPLVMKGTSSRLACSEQREMKNTESLAKMNLS
jgi:hypothetical protein